MQSKKMIHKGHTHILIGTIIAALVAAIGVFLIMMQMEKNMLLQYEKGSILIACKKIPKGQIISEDNAMLFFEMTEIEKQCIPKTALTSWDEIADMVPVQRIDEGVLLTSGMFEKIEEVTADMKTPVIAGFKADDLYQVVGGVLRTGDRIHIYGVTEQGEVKLNWQNVFVQQVFDNAGNHIGSEDKQTSAQRINIYLEQNNVERFYSELAEGSLRVVKVCD